MACKPWLLNSTKGLERRVPMERFGVGWSNRKELVKVLDANGHYRVRVPGNMFGENPVRV